MSMERCGSQESVQSKQSQDSSGSKRSLFSSPSKVGSEGAEVKREHAGPVEGAKKPSTKAERRALQVKIWWALDDNLIIIISECKFCR